MCERCAQYGHLVDVCPKPCAYVPENSVSRRVRKTLDLDMPVNPCAPYVAKDTKQEPQSANKNIALPSWYSEEMGLRTISQPLVPTTCDDMEKQPSY
ncbi:hypothetical protein HPB48_006642 [Haemaphysalis longicornis]|uniref:Uncharacterized protein n=1 Tax=Haemaphysalis longicornis TaxID=44386 RepID=A0A9J6GVR5_HAELO|nr:hypothetical protein HPB48_006642 [Haemaphysalis longicornis]